MSETSERPREVLFCVMKAQLGVSNKELAGIIFSDKPVGGLSPRDRATDPTRRRREFLDGRVDELDPSWELVANGGYAEDLLMSLKRHGGDEAVVDVLGGDGAHDLRLALEKYGLDGALFSNMAVRIVGSQLPQREQAIALIMLFVESAVRGKTGEAIRLVMARERLLGGSELGTMAVQAALASPAPAARLALMRCEGSMLYPQRTYVLNEGEAGTVIGSMALDAGDINDVDSHVSRRHLHIWLGKDGLWRACGLGSTHGTQLISGETGERIVIEAPREEREDEQAAVSVVIGQSDRLILAGTTEFMVVAIPRN